MIPALFLSIIFLILLALAIMGGRYARAGIGEAPLFYSSIFIKFILNIAMLVFIGFSIYLLFFYSWKFFLVLLLIGFVMEVFIIVPLVEKVLFFVVSKIMSRSNKK